MSQMKSEPDSSPSSATLLVGSMPGVFQLSVDALAEAAELVASVGEKPVEVPGSVADVAVADKDDFPKTPVDPVQIKSIELIR